MALYLIQSLEGVKYVGDTFNKVVHVLARETPQCHIADLIRFGRAVAFLPETVTKAEELGYTRCKHCGKSRSRDCAGETIVAAQSGACV